MKKQFLLFLLALHIMLSCSKSKDESPEQSIKITPPSWIQGEWYLEGDAAKSGTFKFTSDDFCIGAFNAYSCNKEALTSMSKAGAAASVKETKSDTEYSIEINLANQFVTYSFQKVSATKIKWTNNPYGGAIDAVFIRK